MARIVQRISQFSFTAVSLPVIRFIKKCKNGLDRQLYRHGIRSAAHLTLPQFVGLGPGQCGTTWLYTQLADHPDIFLPARKEMHYFDQSIHDWSLADYADFFAEGHDRMRGEICPGYSVLRQDRIAFMRSVMPDLRLILIVRDPVERSWSAARRLMGNLGICIEEFGESDFVEYLRQEWAYRTRDGLTLAGDYEPGLLEGYYSRTIDNWLRYFPPEQFLVLLFEELKNDPSSFLGKVCNHIGVGPLPECSNKSMREIINPNPEHHLPERFRRELENIYANEMEILLLRHRGLIR